MTRSLRTALLSALLLLLALPATSHALARGAQSCPGAYSEPNPGNVARISSATFCLLNNERAARGLPRLRANRALTVAAARHSRDMAARNYFGHDTLGGGSFSSRIMAARYVSPRAAWSIGENLAWGTGQLATPASTMEAWMRSPGHRVNILKGTYREIGIGVALSGPKTVYTTDFGRRG